MKKTGTEDSKHLQEPTGRKQIAWNLTPLEYRQFEEAAEAQGVRTGTLVNALLHSLLGTLRECGYSVPRLREMLAAKKKTVAIPDNTRIGHNVGAPSTFQLWGYEFVDDMYSKNDLQPLLMLADHQRYKRPDHVAAGNVDDRTVGKDERPAARPSRKAASQ